MNRLLLVNFFLLYGTAAFAQHTIKGRLIDVNGDPIPFAHILLFQADTASILLHGEIANDNGDFVIEHDRADSVYVKMQSLGFTEYQTTVFYLNGEVELGRLTMAANTEMLDEVVITGQKPLYEQRIDRTIVNVQGSAINAGTNVLNVLSRAPFVRIDRGSNQIAMMGKQGVMVMIDDKPIRLENTDLIHLLSNMSSGNIESIELITSPPSNYDAQGVAGIINIRTIKKREGFTGQFSANAGYGQRGKFGGALNMSYQKGKLFTYANLSSGTDYTREEVVIAAKSSDLKSQSDIQVDRVPTTALHSAEVGLDYQISRNTSIGLSFSVLESDWKMSSLATTTSSSNGSTFVSTTESYEKNKMLKTISSVELSQRLSERTVLDAGYDHTRFERRNPTNYTVINNDSTSNFISNATTPLSIDVVTADVRHAVNKKIEVSSGIKGTFSNFNNNVTVANEHEGAMIDDTRFTDAFSMDERILAAYASGDFALSPRVKLVTGIRYEHYYLDISSKNSGRISSRTNGLLFPSVFLSYKPDDNQEFSVSYVNRIQRPGFLILAPYFYFFDPNTLYTGNPTILPARSNQLQLNLNNFGAITTLQYTSIREPIVDQQPTLNTDDGIIIVRPLQGNRNNVLSLNIALPFTVTNWWSAHLNLLGIRQYLRLPINETLFEKTSANYEVSVTQTWKLPAEFEIELSAFYNSSYYFGVMRQLARHQVDIGIRKTIKFGPTLSLNVSDAFNTGYKWPTQSSSLLEGLDYRFSWNGEGRVVRFNVTVPLGNRHLKAREERMRSKEEQERLN